MNVPKRNWLAIARGAIILIIILTMFAGCGEREPIRPNKNASSYVALTPRYLTPRSTPRPPAPKDLGISMAEVVGYYPDVHWNLNNVIKDSSGSSRALIGQDRHGHRIGMSWDESIPGEPEPYEVLYHGPMGGGETATNDHYIRMTVQLAAKECDTCLKWAMDNKGTLKRGSSGIDIDKRTKTTDTGKRIELSGDGRTWVQVRVTVRGR